MHVELFPSGDSARMVTTLNPMHGGEFMKLHTVGFTSQLSKLERRFGQVGA